MKRPSQALARMTSALARPVAHTLLLGVITIGLMCLAAVLWLSRR